MLLYSFGRGAYSSAISQFIVAEAKGISRRLPSSGQLQTASHTIAAGDWPQLNRSFLARAAYLGFERFFAVAFWFIVLGPVGAVVYRCSQLWAERWPSASRSRWLWLLEGQRFKY